MNTTRTAAAFLFCLALALVASAQAPDVTTAHGKALKSDKESLTFQPRAESGKFGKSVTLHVTGTTRITTLSTQMRDKKTIMVQKDTKAEDVPAGASISVIYATAGGQEPVLLSAVVQPSEK